MSNSPVCRIFIDTTELFSNPRMDGPTFDLLGSFVRRTESCLYVPKVVIDETINHFRIRLEKAVNDATVRLRDVGRLVGADSIPFLICVKTETDKYERHLLRKLESWEARIVAYEQISLERIVTRALHRLKPFDGDGKKGFRDAIIWETVLNEMAQDLGTPTLYIFISNNSQDFGKDVLANELKADCEKLGVIDRFRLFNRLSDFIDEFVKPHLAHLDELGKQIENEGYKDFRLSTFFYNISNVIEDDIRKVSIWHGVSSQLHALTGFHSFSLKRLDDDCDGIEVVDTWRVDQQSVVIGVDFVAFAFVNGLESIEDYYGDGDELGIEQSEELRELSVRCKIIMSITLDEETGEVGSFEVNDVEVLSAK